jgi:hypothetical protein
MAVEAKRGCGYRKVGGLYMVGGGIGIPCDRLPFELTVCSCCGQGIKQARGWTWIDVAKFFQGPHVLPIGAGSIAPPEKLWPCYCGGSQCPLCFQPENMGRAGLLWIGEKFYKFPGQFVKEGVELGFSRRIKAVPQGFKIGETWVMLAHSKAVVTSQIAAHTGPDTVVTETIYKPGIFYCWLPQRLEKIVVESSRGSEEITTLEKRGITPVFVPDSDKDHQGNVHDDLDNEKKLEAGE